jgi:hypothetical protein
MIDFRDYESSVRPVKVSIFFDKELVPKDELSLFGALEREMDRELLDNYFPLSIGSGFFVTDTGHIITCHHVVDMNTVGSKLTTVMLHFLNTLDDEYSYLFEEKQFADISDTISKFFVEGEIRRFVSLSDEEDLELKLIDSDCERDLALLELVNPRPTKPMLIMKSNAIDEVRQVFSIGYPLHGILDRYFEEVTPAVTSGIVSAIRHRLSESGSKTQVETIQHTASVSPGNSGGPLITDTGLVAGINSSLLRGANNVYFAISTSELISWLEGTGIAGQLRLRSYVPGQASSKPLLPISVNFSTLPIDAEIYIDGEIKGRSPFSTTLSGPRGYNVRISKPGCLDLLDIIVVTGEEELIFDYQLEAGAKVLFTEPLPPTVRVLAVQNENTLTFEYDEPLLLPSGRWDIALEGPIANNSTQAVSVTDIDIHLSPDRFLEDMIFRLSNLRPESNIFLEGRQVSVSSSEKTLLLPYDKAEYLIVTPNYKDIILKVSPDYTTTNYEIAMDYRPTNQIKSRRQISWGLSFLISGALVAGTSIAFNLDSVSIQLTNDYSGYATLKNTTFGTFLAGTASLIGGLITTLNGVRLKSSLDGPIITEVDSAGSFSRL